MFTTFTSSRYRRRSGPTSRHSMPLHLRRGLLLLLLFCLATATLPVASAQTAASVSMDSVRADRLDVDNDGVADMIRVVHLVNTSDQWASVGVEVIASSSGMSLNFWDNFTVNSSAPHLGSIDISAWSDGDYAIIVRLWDNELAVLLYEQDLGEFAMTASLSGPMISLLLQAPPALHTGDPCEIQRTFSDEVGDHYDVTGQLVLSGVPWLVLASADSIDCSRWPAGDYHVVEQYQNGLGFFVTEQISFTINNHPPPEFDLLVNGSNGRLGDTCSIEVIARGETNLLGTSVDWAVSDPRNKDVELPGDSLIDCTDWSPGLHKVQVTLTSPQGQKTVDGVNIIRVPPSNMSAAETANISGSENWPAHSAGENYKPEPMFYSSVASTAAVVGIGTLVAVLLGVLVGLMMTRQKLDESYDRPYGGLAVEEYAASEADGLPTYSDPQGIVWRQYPDGSMDWFDETSGQWVAYQQ